MTVRLIAAILGSALLLCRATPAISSLAIDSCAVLPFGWHGDPEAGRNIAWLTQRYTQELSQSEDFQVPPLNQTLKTLNEHAFLPGNYISPLSAARAAGKMLSVSHVIRGRVDQMDDSYTLLTTLVEIQRGIEIRAARSTYKGSITNFIRLVPASNISILLNPQHAGSDPPAIHRMEASRENSARPGRNVPIQEAAPIVLGSVPSENQAADDEPAVRPLRSWNIPWTLSRQRQEDEPSGEEANRYPFLRFLDDHLVVGARINTFSLDSTSGSFIGTINGLEEDQSRTPELFFDWLFIPYAGIDLTWTKVSALTRTSTHAASDGSVEMSGPILSIFGRYPFELETGSRTIRLSPYAGIGLAFLNADFIAEGWWHYGFGNVEQYDQWIANGYPPGLLGNYTRSMNLTDDTGRVFYLGCSVIVWNNVSLDVNFRTVDADTDATFVRAYSGGNSETISGRFSMNHSSYGLGVRYSF